MLTVLPTPAPPNRPTLPPFANGHQQIDDLDAGYQEILTARLFVVRGSGPVDGQVNGRVHGASLVLRLAQHVHDSPERRLAHRHGDSLAGIGDGQAAAQTVRRSHRDGAHDAVAELLLHLEGQIHLSSLRAS